MSPDSGGSGQAEPNTDPEQTCCKVQRTATTYRMDGITAELASRREDGDSFRDIATYFNTQVISKALSDAEVAEDRSVHAALAGDTIAEDIYDVLRTDRDSDIRRAEVRARLADSGVDVDELERSFVSHVTIRSHLQDCVGVEPEETPTPFEKTVNTAQGARNRAMNVIQSTLDRAVKDGKIQAGDLETEILVQVTCQDCGDTFYLTELLEDRECSCSGSSGSISRV